jgi:predicted DNA-binding protein (MmcQ/YjbR family)
MAGQSRDRLLEVARRRCEELSGGPGEFPFGVNTEVHKVGGKMFIHMTLNRDPVPIVVKLPPELGAELRAAFPDTVSPGYYMNKVHWNTILLAGAPAEEELIDLIDISSDLVRSALPRRVRDSIATAAATGAGG